MSVSMHKKQSGMPAIEPTEWPSMVNEVQQTATVPAANLALGEQV